MFIMYQKSSSTKIQQIKSKTRELQKKLSKQNNFNAYNFLKKENCAKL